MLEQYLSIGSIIASGLRFGPVLIATQEDIELAIVIKIIAIDCIHRRELGFDGKRPGSEMTCTIIIEYRGL